MSEIKKVEKKITEQVLARVNQLQEAKQLDLPADFSASNAIRAAELILVETTNKNGKPVLEACSQPSIARALLKMVISGLSPIKGQCYFVPFGDKLTFMPSYNGRIAWAKRIGLKRITSNVIYEGDANGFKYETDSETGLTKVLAHPQSFANIDMNKIAGAYATYEMEDGFKDVEIMTMTQIRKAWMQGATKGDSPAHKNFTDQMCRKTVIGRACTAIINRSTDAYLDADNSEHSETLADNTANTMDIGFEEISETPEPEKKKPGRPPKEEAKSPEPTSDKQDEEGLNQAALEFEQQEMERQEQKAKNQTGRP